jgi:hypothetical protein
MAESKKPKKEGDKRRARPTASQKRSKAGERNDLKK